MNAMAVITATEISTDPAFETWVSTGRDLLAQRTAIDWQLSDWIASGQDQFGAQLPLDLLADELGIAPKRLKAAASTAKAFPPALRDASLTFDHHAAVATLPRDEALPLLKMARENRLDEREVRQEAVKRKAEIGQVCNFTDEDWEHHELMTITRAWNNARRLVREQFMDLARESEWGPIDA